MKTLFVCLVAFLFAFIIGCQENMLNEPQTSLEKKTDSINRNTIKICCEVRDPQAGVCNLSGYVNYAHQVINRTMNPMGLYEISLYLEMDSKLCDKLGMVHLEWRIQGKSNDIVYVSEEGILLVEKTYWITNRSDVVLLVQYLVTTNGVGISSVNLVPLEK
jgi:hypothetical protein